MNKVPGVFEIPEAKPATRAEELRHRLADDIIMGRLAPGVRLDEASLAKRFGVSRTPVREALGQLAVMGLVEGRPHRGVHVTSISSARMGQLFELMAEYEGACARMSAKRMSPSERRHLETIHEDSREAMRTGDEASYGRANDAFHEALYAGSHNDFLSDAARTTKQRLSPFRTAQFRQVGRLHRSFEEHGRVVEAILRGDQNDAEATIRDHVLYVNEAFITFIAGVERPDNGAD